MCALLSAAVRFLDGHSVVEKGGVCPARVHTASSPPTNQRAVLEKRARFHTAAYWEVVRARIVLLASEEVSNQEIAKRLYTSPQVVWKWRKRFYEEGLEGLEDRPRSGRPPSFSP